MVLNDVRLLGVLLNAGNQDELTVLVDGRPAARKWLLFKPSVAKVRAAVRETPAPVER